ncbi:MAG: energy-coupling factor ABC transporter ATP-binding protein [Anaerolineae bacterium]
MAIIDIDHLAFTYPIVSPEMAVVTVLNDINLKVERGEWLAIMGPTGAGKSTLCLALNGVVPHMTGGEFLGHISIRNLDTLSSSPADLAEHIGIVYQDPESQLFCATVEEEVAFGPENLGLVPQEIEERVSWALSVVDMSAYRSASPTRLSGGQKQRVAIAASLVMLPEILILDEPTSSLDPVGQTEVFNVINRLRHERQMTLVLVSADAERVAQYATRLVLLVNGRIIADGEPGALLTDIVLTQMAGITPPQMTELAWDMNARYGSQHAWVHLDQAEAALRAQLKIVQRP